MNRIFIYLFIAYFFSIFSQQNVTEQSSTQNVQENIASETDDSFKNKTKLLSNDLKNKKEKSYFTGLPLFNYNPIAGFGFGVRGYYYYNGKKSDPRFEYTPYLHKVFLEVFVTTALRQRYRIFWDAPYMVKLGKAWLRFKSNLYYEEFLSYSYFGIGDNSNDPLSFRGKRFPKISDYEKELGNVSNTNGTTNYFYNYYKYQLPTFDISTEISAVNFWGGTLRTLFGLSFRWSNITDYSGQNVKVGGKSYIANDTKLKEDVQSGKVFGLGSSWDNTIKVGIAFDSRDYEPNPHRGVFTDFVAEAVPQFLGSNTNYYRFTYTLRLFYDPIPKYPNFILAARSLYTFNLGNVPFYAMNEIGTTEGANIKGALGGGDSFRGYLSNRFIGNAKSLSNFEIRWQFWDVSFWKQHFAFMLVPFFEVGRAFDSIQKTSYRDWKLSYGSGFRIIWNQATIITFDYAFSKEAQYFYLDFDHQF